MPKIIKKKEKKQLIVRAALAVFAKKGVSNTKIADIAEAGGFGKGTIYDYFRSKDEIFMAAFSHFDELMKTEIARRMFLITDPQKKLMTFIEASFEIWLEHADFAEIMFDYWAEGIRDRHDNIDLQAIYDEYGDFIAAILDDGTRKGVFRNMDSKMVAAFIIAGMDGLVLQWLVHKKKFPVLDARKEFIKTILQGISRRD